MTTAHIAHSHQGILHGLLSNYAEAKTERFRKQIFAKTVRDLERLSDQQLSDIGIVREDIKQRAYQSVYHHASLAQ
ncbi:MAG: DUF1127 domain-containing protein [Ruegeria sp.]